MREILFLIFLSTALNLNAQYKKLLPVEVKSDKMCFKYTYDDQCRFTTIIGTFKDNLIQRDSIAYNADTVEVWHYGYEDDGKRITNRGQRLTFKRLEENAFSVFATSDWGGYNESKVIVKFNSQNRIIYSHLFDNEDSNDDILYEFEYDDAGNPINVVIPPNVSLEYVNPVFQTFAHRKVIFDSKNGIFKNVEPIYSLYEFLNYDRFPYLLYLDHNMLNIIGKDEEDQTDFTTDIEYNEYNYPVNIYGMTIKYIEAEQ